MRDEEVGVGGGGDAVHTGREPSRTDNNNFSCGARVIRPVCQSTAVAASASTAPVIIQDIVFQRQRTASEPKVGREQG